MRIARGRPLASGCTFYFHGSVAMVALLKMPKEERTLRLERRTFARKEVHAWVEGRRLDHTVPALRDPRLALAMCDLSAGGMAAISSLPLGVGERVSVFFPPQGAQRGWDAYGRVIRCDPSATGYRVAMEFDSLPAA